MIVLLRNGSMGLLTLTFQKWNSNYTLFFNVIKYYLIVGKTAFIAI